MSFAGTGVSVNTVFSGATGPAGAALGTSIFLVVVAMFLHLEFQRRAGRGPVIEGCKQLMRKCAPEAAGLLVCLTLAAALRARGADRGPQMDEGDAEVWEQIKVQWPWLLTADTLLSLQAMLRLMALLSTALRSGGGTSAGAVLPLSEETTALWLGAGVARLLLLTQSTVYMLDGPLGGILASSCEIAVLPILFMLSRGSMRRAAATLALVMGISMYLAHRNRLQLHGEAMGDALFILAHILDCLAAFSYALRTILMDCSVQEISVGFTHLMMPIQQGLAAYYFLQAFDFVPELVGAGVPFEVLQIGNAVSFGAYLGASMLYFAEALDVHVHAERVP